MIFETNANLSQEQIEDIKKSLNQILSTDLIVLLGSDRIIWYDDEEEIQ